MMMAVAVMVGTGTVTGRKPSRRARALQAAMRAAGLGAQYGSSRFLLGLILTRSGFLLGLIQTRMQLPRTT
jgi:hypothetical protein